MTRISSVRSCFTRLCATAEHVDAEPGTLAQVILNELEEVWSLIPDESKAALMGVAVVLHRQFADETWSDIQAMHAVEKMRGQR